MTISRTRRLVEEAMHQAVFGWVLRELARSGLLKGKTVGIDATTLEANAAMKSIVRRDTGESYTEYLRRRFWRHIPRSRCTSRPPTRPG